ncbi:hypothetical protein K5X82_00810 [Halosquirtibacter xylanolyticus]|uniref:hypothetical protein n=1 Tax=Halosquirtibacter xylanolyticus TaxID=3374599 RepID=UPI0037479CD5|nr:hypothetical protein K5X82_00810 [Prolixibacteraceae bacterium]
MVAESQYLQVQFIGHALSTTPELKVSVEGMSDWGKYLGDKEDANDIQTRLDVVRSVLLQLLEAKEIDHTNTTLKIFALPEFFWRGIKGAYHYDVKKEDRIYQKITSELINMVDQLKQKYNLDDWLFLFGSILTTHDITDSVTKEDKTLAKLGNDYLGVYNILDPVSNSHIRELFANVVKIADKKKRSNSDKEKYLSALLTDLLDLSDALAKKMVYNRCFVYYAGNSYAIQKEHKSKEDFILNNPSATEDHVDYYLQTMVNYPSIDAKINPVDTLPLSNIKCKNLKVGVEICLDHRRKRLADYLKEGKIEAVDIQIVISCGMQLHDDAVATKDRGVLFNCDGEYELKGEAVNGDHCHTQLKTYHASKKPSLSDYMSVKKIIPVDMKTKSKYFPHGLGSIHVYLPIGTPS